MHTGPENNIPKLEKPLYSFLALKGGGAKGLVHLGVAIALDHLKIYDDIEMVAGSSAGAIAALLAATGWSLPKITDTLSRFNTAEKLSLEGSIGPYWRFLTEHGFYTGEHLTQWFEQIIKEVTGKDNVKFLDWHEKKVELDKAYKQALESPSTDSEVPIRRMKHIIVEACNIGTGFNEVFSHISEHKDVSISLAISASMAFPGYFTPKEIKGQKFSDGGIQSDCPISQFELSTGQGNPHMLAVWLDTRERIDYALNNVPPVSSGVRSLAEFGYSTGVALYNVQLSNLRRNAHKEKIIYCDTLDVDTMDFSLSDEKKQLLVQSGIYGVVRYFMMYHPDYTRQFFDKTLLDRMVELNFPISRSDWGEPPIFIPWSESEMCIKSDEMWCDKEIAENWLPQFNTNRHEENTSKDESNIPVPMSMSP